ncbi:hypothetical protein QA640_13265 [Bradyrhizobium sp. CB82]|uniref:extracellular catalytic domain type 2 short-chain-length polyhydroxyalkanoate depolymerase n=1 Tax=Bradyrhizobium sp. CB82 TaxID=3039159 RepID=UPI0024B25B73|nr:hypothetical protein [Bradyrhizobium sp. CB82]WFU43326.1 hypothetical protein QA640_13265 [Bradyrhizobium sp. CB82]
MDTAKLRQCLAAALLCAGAFTPSPLTAEPAALRGYNAPIGESSISGISSGAFMAVQFGTAWSSVIKGVGVVAGGPYWCAKADAIAWSLWYLGGPASRAEGACLKGPASELTLSDFTAKADAEASAGGIDPLDNLGGQKIYLFHGYNDSKVARAATDAAADFYRHYLGDANRGNLFYQTTLGAGHSFVVAKPAGGLNACNANQSPFINQCGYDQAGIILQHIYGRLNPPNPGQLAGTVKIFDQSIYTKPLPPDSLSLDDRGYVFVPKDCEQESARCRIHVALHGCKQDEGEVKRQFVDDAGYNAWADNNHLIVLYPQTKVSRFWPTNWYACWDWWGYVDYLDSYVTKSGPQVKAIKAMLDALTAGAAPPDETPASFPAAPDGLAVIDTSDTAADLVWSPVAGATTYRVSRASADGAFQTIREVAGPSFGDSGLTPQTTYRWHVSAIANGAAGPTSVDTAATTRATPAPCGSPGSCPVSK